jgi:hypothetical protein
MIDVQGLSSFECKILFFGVKGLNVFGVQGLSSFERKVLAFGVQGLIVLGVQGLSSCERTRITFWESSFESTCKILAFPSFGVQGSSCLESKVLAFGVQGLIVCGVFSCESVESVVSWGVHGVMVLAEPHGVIVLGVEHSSSLRLSSMRLCDLLQHFASNCCKLSWAPASSEPRGVQASVFSSPLTLSASIWAFLAHSMSNLQVRWQASRSSAEQAFGPERRCIMSFAVSYVSLKNSSSNWRSPPSELRAPLPIASSEQRSNLGTGSIAGGLTFMAIVHTKGKNQDAMYK